MRPVNVIESFSSKVLASSAILCFYFNAKKLKMMGRTCFHPVGFHWTMKSGRSMSEWSLNANLQRMKAQIFRGAIFDCDMKAEGQVHS